MPRDRSSLLIGVVCGVLVLVAVVMIAVGLPEQTLLQTRLLQLYSVPLSAALTLGVVHLTSRLPSVNRVTRLVLLGCGLVALVGVGVMAAALVLGQPGLLPLGQSVTWLSLGAALLWVVGQFPRRADGQARTFGLRPIDEDDDGA